MSNSVPLETAAAATGLGPTHPQGAPSVARPTTPPPSSSSTSPGGTTSPRHSPRLHNHPLLPLPPTPSPPPLPAAAASSSPAARPSSPSTPAASACVSSVPPTVPAIVVAHGTGGSGSGGGGGTVAPPPIPTSQPPSLASFYASRHLSMSAASPHRLSTSMSGGVTGGTNVNVVTPPTSPHSLVPLSPPPSSSSLSPTFSSSGSPPVMPQGPNAPFSLSGHSQNSIHHTSSSSAESCVIQGTAQTPSQANSFIAKGQVPPPTGESILNIEQQQQGGNSMSPPSTSSSSASMSTASLMNEIGNLPALGSSSPSGGAQDSPVLNRPPSARISTGPRYPTISNTTNITLDEKRLSFDLKVNANHYSPTPPSSPPPSNNVSSPHSLQPFNPLNVSTPSFGGSPVTSSMSMLATSAVYASFAYPPSTLSAVPPRTGMVPASPSASSANTKLMLRNKNLKSLQNHQSLLHSGITFAELSVNEFTTIPPELQTMTTLTTLKIFHNLIDRAPHWLPALSAVTCLEMGRNSLPNFPSELCALTSLRDLDLNWNKISQVPAELGNLQKLKCLNLSINKITEDTWAPPSAQLQGVEMLDISHNLFQHLPPALEQFTKVSNLNLSSCRLAEIPPQISSMQSLSKLDLKYNSLTTIAAEIGSLSNLTTLHLGFNKLTQLPGEIGQLHLLKELTVNNNSLTSLPSTIGDLSELRKLHLWHNNLSSFPDEMGNLSHLCELDASHNHLKSIPSTFTRLLSLRNVTITHNSLPLTLHLPVGINELILSSNEVEGDIPAFYRDLKELRQLDLMNNKVYDFPSHLRIISDLRNLHMAGNCLVSLPEHLIGYSALTSLNIAANNLMSLPATSIKTFKALQFLYLGHNKLTELPHTLSELTSLKILHLSGNPLMVFPPILGSSPVYTSSPSGTSASPSGLSQLKQLFLSQCEIPKLPKDISALKALEVLDLSYNELKDVGALDGLTSLKDLNISNNPGITALPKTFSNLINLVDLYCSCCSLCSIPEELGTLRRLSQCIIQHNNLACVPDFEGVWFGSGDLVAPRCDNTITPTMSVQINWSSMCGRRPEMQDACSIFSHLKDDPVCHFAAVFDGHSGFETARYSASRLCAHIIDHLCSPTSPSVPSGTTTASSINNSAAANGIGTSAGGLSVQVSPVDALMRSVEKLQAEIKGDALKDGSTGIAALILDMDLYILNIGDSRAVLCRNGKAIPLSQDQKPDTPSELQRIINADGFVANGRVNGELALSRALGDWLFRPALSPKPQITCRRLDKADEFIILACDGIWDVLTNQQAVNVVRKSNIVDKKYAAATLRDYAYLMGSSDNLSTIVLHFNHLEKTKLGGS